jgi:putative multiple sugar transport system substrate-binding protein
MNRFLRGLALISATALLFGVTELSAQTKKKVGISMPTRSLQRWFQDGTNMKKTLEARGYQVELQYAQDNVNDQVAQIENLVTKGVDALIIAPIDGDSLTNVLEKANAEKIPVISYDRLIRNTPYISYYATFDNFKVGVAQGSYIVKALGLDKGKKGPFNIELFGGSPDDNNAGFFFKGAMSQLSPYIDSGVLVVRSKQVEFNKIAIMGWDGATAQQRMDNLLTSKYTDARVDAVLAPNDAIAIGIVSSLKSVGYGQGNKKMPIVTGQDADIASVKSIIAGEQTQTVFKDTRILAKRAADMVDSVLKGTKAEVNDTKTYDNGKKIVPSFLCDPISVDKTNYKTILLNSGYYTEKQLK